MNTYIVLVNLWDDNFINTFQGTVEVRATDETKAREIAEFIEGVAFASDVTLKELDVNPLEL